jgi:hypothetical protein
MIEGETSRFKWTTVGTRRRAGHYTERRISPTMGVPGLLSCSIVDGAALPPHVSEPERVPTAMLTVRWLLDHSLSKFIDN